MNSSLHEKILFNRPVTKDEDFYFFDKIVSKLMDFYTKDIRSFAILVSDRRTGKTTLLYKFQRSVSEISEDSIFVLILEGSSGIETDNPEAWLAKEIYDGCLRALNIDANQMETFSLEDYDRTRFILLLRNLSSKFPDKRFIFAIDEFDVWMIETAREKHEKEALAGLLNSILEASRSSENNLPIQVVLTVTRLPTRLNITEYDYVERLRPFDKDDLREMVERILDGEISKLDDFDFEVICKLSGCWPWYAKFILECAYHENIDLSPGWPKGIMDVLYAHNFTDGTQSAIEQLIDGIEKIFSLHYSTEFERGMILIMGKLKELSSEQLANLNDNFLKALERLKGRNIVEGSAKDGYRLTIELLSFWVDHEWDRLSLMFDELYAPQLPESLCRMIKKSVYIK